jgi:hypothetical protein
MMGGRLEWWNDGKETGIMEWWKDGRMGWIVQRGA